MTRILLSLFTIAVVIASATAATLAFFQNTTSFSNPNSVLNSTGDVAFTGELTTDNGTPTPFTASLLPGQTVNRCLWLRNTGGVPAHFKVYMKPGSEVFTPNNTTAFADALRITGKTILDANRCTTNPPSISGANAGLYNNFDQSSWTNVLVRGSGFWTKETTPFKSLVLNAAMLPNQFSVWQLDLSLPSTADSTVANQTYQFQGEVFAVQEGGAIDPTPTPTGL